MLRAIFISLLILSQLQLRAQPAKNSTFLPDRKHPDEGLLPDDAPCSDCEEILAERTARRRVYHAIDSNGNRIIVEKANGPLNYLDSNGFWRDINPRLTPARHGIYMEALRQPFPTRIHRKTLEAGIRINDQWIAFNRNTRIVFSGLPDSILTLAPHAANAEFTENGMQARIEGTDMLLEYRAEKGGIKSTIILNDPSEIPGIFETFSWQSRLLLPEGCYIAALSGRMDGSLWKGRLAVFDEKGEALLEIAAPLIYDAAGTVMSENYGYLFEKRQSGNEYLLTLRIGLDWLRAPGRKFPVVIDPLLSAVDSNQGGIGFEPSGFCFDPNDYCSNVLTVTVPGKSTLVAARSSVRLRTINGGCNGSCDPVKAGFRIYGPCSNRYVPFNSFYSPPNSTAFDHIFAGIDLFNNINCAPFSCPDHQISFEMRTYSCSCPAGATCGVECHQILPGDWKVVIEARTLEAFIFEGDSVEVCYGETVSFNSRSSYGVPPYSYLWTPDNVSTPNGSAFPVFADTIATLRVTDACGTVVRDTTRIKVNPLPLIQFTNIIPACKGQKSGEVTASVSNGPGPFVYQWSSTPPQNTATASGLDPGWYRVTVTDGKGCVNIDSVEITQPANALSIQVTGQDVSCNSSNDGSAQVNISSGNPPYDITWSNGSKSAGINTLSAGYYSVTVSDASGCIDTAGILIRNTGNITLSLIVDSISCHGAKNGIIQANVSGDAPPFTYLWSTGSTADRIFDLGPGSYSLTISDSNGCQAESSVTLSEPDSLLLQISAFPESCTGGGNNGMAIARVTGGTPPYSYFWNSSPNQFGDTAVNLRAGSYIVTVFDKNNCRVTGSATIDPPANYQISFDTIPVSCFNGNDGQVTVHVRGGQEPYTFQWNTPGNDKDSMVTGLGAGFYTVTITDAGNCSIIRNIQISQPDEIQVNVIASNVSCPGRSDGEVTVIPSGGNPPYRYQWNTPNQDQTQTVSGLPAGNYELYISDSNQCRDTFSISIGNPDTIRVNIVSNDPACPGVDNGSIILEYSGGRPPLSISWSGNLPPADTLTGLAAGSYYLSIRDANGCSYLDTVSLQYDTRLLLSVQAADESCPGKTDGSIRILVQGGTGPFSYLWNDGRNGSLLDSLGAGIYALTVSDSNGCTADTSITLTSSAAFSVDLGPDITIDAGAELTITPVVNPPGNYQFIWKPGRGLSDSLSEIVIASPKQSTTYILTVINADGCTASDSIAVNIRPSVLVGLPNAFSPNGDGINDLFFVHPAVEISEIRIYDRWGQLIYLGTSPWNGRYASGSPAPAGMYVFRAVLQYPGSEFRFEVKGEVILLR